MSLRDKLKQKENWRKRSRKRKRTRRKPSKLDSKRSWKARRTGQKVKMPKDWMLDLTTLIRNSEMLSKTIFWRENRVISQGRNFPKISKKEWKRTTK